MLPRLRFDEERMAQAASDPALLATEIADYLVERGVPFRESHEIVGRAVKRAPAPHWPSPKKTPLEPP